MRSDRSRRVAAIGAFVVLAIVVLNAALALLYRDSRRNLETELGRRLENVVAVLARGIDPAWVEEARIERAFHAARKAPPESLLVAPAHDALREVLRDAADETDLANLRLYDGEGQVLLDLAAGVFGLPASQPLDPAGLAAAFAGSTTHSALYQSGDEFLMAGYAPVRDPEGAPIGVLVVETDARFFGALQRLRLAMAASAALSVLVLAGLGAIFVRLQASLARAEEAVQRAETLAAMGRMTAAIAHEIRNPLGIIKATAARLRKRYDDPQAPDERFAYIDEEVDRLDGILTSYLQFARDEPPALAPLDLVPFLQRCLQHATPELEAAGVRAQADFPASCIVTGDAPHLQQVVLNLVLNAVQAMPAGGTVRLRLAAAGDRAQLDVLDDGPGFDPAILARVFEPFVTTKERGSGLGLAIAQRIVRQHGGRIAVSAGPQGRGARVTLELPLARGLAEGT